MIIFAWRIPGVREIIINTNAVRLANADFCQALKDAGLDIASVTLIAPDAELSDSITRTPGTFEKTVIGAQNLIHSKVHTLFHFVILEQNYRILPEFIHFVYRTFCDGGKNNIPITFSYVAPPLEEIVKNGYVPRFSDAVPFLRRAMDICTELQIPFGANEGLKGLPPCVLDGDRRYFRLLSHLFRRTGSDFVKKPECMECVFCDRCYGVRKYYAAYYGLDEIHPVREEK